MANPDSQTLNQWYELLDQRYGPEIQDFVLNYTGNGDFKVSFRDLERIDPEFADDVVMSPTNHLEAAKRSLQKYFRDSHFITVGLNEVGVQVTDLPLQYKVGIDRLGSHHHNRLVAIDGLVKKVTCLLPTMTVADFLCDCGNGIQITQTGEKLTRPGPCQGCNAANLWKLQVDTSWYEDFQKVQIQERPDSVDGGRQPEKTVVQLSKGLLRSMVPGDRVEITGILKLKTKKGTREMESLFDATGVKQHDKEFSELKITEEFEKEAKAFAAQGNVLPRLVANIATSIHGMSFEKNSVLLAVFGGVQRKRPDGSVRRGNIHVLFTGDPGVAKSQLLKFFSKIVPRSVFASGKGASGVGLTAAVVKDELSGSQGFTVEAGAMVLANGGVLFLDELDKMNDNDRSALHAAMEQGTVPINKAGINMELNANCPVIAAANPEDGRFDPHTPLFQQINLTPALISRFDLIFILKDSPDAGKDDALAEHIFNNELGETAVATLSTDFIRKYIAYAKRFEPVHTKESLEPFKPYYKTMRSTVDNTTPRQLEALLRLAEAHAKANLRDKVLREDSEAALTIHRAYLESQATDVSTGNLDLGNVSGAGITVSQHDRNKIVLNIVREQSKESVTGYTNEELVLEAGTKMRLSKTDVEKAIENLRRAGSVYAPAGGTSLKA